MTGLRVAVLAVLCGSAAASDFEDLLASLKGKTTVDCKAVCKSVGKSFSGMGMSSAGEVAFWNCKCGSDRVVVACTGKPFMQCCKDKCAGADCPSKPAGWSCPSGGGCSSKKCKSDNWKEWVAAHNIYRCMHDVPALSWNEDVYADAAKHFKSVKTMIHSKMYDVKPPAGPAGENLFQGTGKYSPLDAVKAWYSEIKDCGKMPGCKNGATKPVGHFTAMSWNGAKDIGCFNNKYNLWGCRYKALDYKSCNTPNYGSDEDWAHNVYPRKNTFKDCLAKVKKCGLPAPKGSEAVDSTTGYDEEDFDLADVLPGGNGVTYLGAFATASLSLAAAAGLVRVWKSSRQPSLVVDSALMQSDTEQEVPE
jgi:hypothetical protein